MPLPQNKRLTYADLLSWPEEERCELYGGQVLDLASPSVRHQRAVGEIYAQLHDFLRKKPCQAFLAPMDLRLFEQDGDAPEDVDTVLQPDLMVVCGKGQIDERGIRGAPSLVVEILSESTKQYDRVVKYSLYQKAGVPEYWLVDPERKTLQVYTLDEGKYHAGVAYTAASSVPVGVLEGCAIDLRPVFEE